MEPYHDGICGSYFTDYIDLQYSTVLTAYYCGYLTLLSRRLLATFIIYIILPYLYEYSSLCLFVYYLYVFLYVPPFSFFWLDDDGRRHFAPLYRRQLAHLPTTVGARRRVLFGVGGGKGRG